MDDGAPMKNVSWRPARIGVLHRSQRQWSGLADDPTHAVTPDIFGNFGVPHTNTKIIRLQSEGAWRPEADIARSCTCSWGNGYSVPQADVASSRAKVVNGSTIIYEALPLSTGIHLAFVRESNKYDGLIQSPFNHTFWGS
jgi:hypothetical protein